MFAAMKTLKTLSATALSRVVRGYFQQSTQVEKKSVVEKTKNKHKTKTNVESIAVVMTMPTKTKQNNEL